jgi:hypothetical protein
VSGCNGKGLIGGGSGGMFIGRNRVDVGRSVGIIRFFLRRLSPPLDR